MIERLTHITERAMEWLIALALGLIVVLVFSNVVARYGSDLVASYGPRLGINIKLGSGFAGAEELSLLLFLWLVFLGSILALRQHAHLGMELVQALLPRRLRLVCAVLTHLLMLYLLWLFLAGSWDQTVIGLSTYSTVLHYPMAWRAASGLVCAAGMMLIVGVNLVRILIRSPGARVAGDPAPPPDTPPANAQPASAAKDARS